MVLRPLRKVGLPEVSEQAGAAWLAELEQALAAPGADWYRICRDTLAGLYFPGLDVDRALADPKTSLATRSALFHSSVRSADRPRGPNTANQFTTS